MSSTRYGSCRAGIAALVAFAALAASGCAPSKPVASVRLGHAATLGVALDVIAEELGYFGREGLDVTLVQVASGNVAVNGVLSGELDVAVATIYPIVLASFSGDELRVFGSVSVSRNNNVIIARSDRGIASIADLEGRKVGTLAGGNPEFVLGLMLLEGGVPSERVDIVKGELAAMYERFAAGELDAIACFGVWVDRAESAHPGRTVVFMDEDIVRTTSALAARKEALERDGPTYERLLRALVRAEEYVRKYPDKAFELSVKALGIDAEQNRPLWYPDVYGVRLDQSIIRDMENMARWQIDSGSAGSESMPDVLSLFDFRPLERIDAKRVTVIH